MEQSKTAAVNRCFYILRQIFRSRAMNKAVKIKVHNTVVKPAVVFGRETLAMAETDMKGLGTWERKISRIHGPVGEQGIWRVSHQELRELYKDLYTVADIKKKRLEWIGHVVGMDQGRTVKKIFESKPERSRRRGRTTLRWLQAVRKDTWETKFKRWRQKTVDREEWVSLIKQTMALRGPQSQGVRK
jgi:hypothetical protein